MPWMPSVQSRIALNTSAPVASNFNSTVFVTTNAYFTERVRFYGSFDEIRNDPAIPTDSNAYVALRQAASVESGFAVPIALGRRQFDDVTLTALEAKDNNEFKFDLNIVADGEFTPTKYEISFTTGVGATLADISAGIEAAFTSAAVVGASLVDNLDGSVTLTETVGYKLYIENLTDLKDSYTSSETAAELFSALVEEANENFYFIATEDHTESFVLEMAAEVEATESSDFPKQYHVSTQEASTLAPLADPAVDILGKLKELNFNRTHAQWHHEADTAFPEMVPSPYNGKFQPGGTTWKFIPIAGGLSVARDPVTGKELSKFKAGYILDRNASVFVEERGVPFYHGGKMSSGEWVDVVRAKDWINDTIEVRLLRLLLNQKGSKLTFGKKDKLKIANTIDGVLSEAVQFGILNGFVPTEVPETVSFEDQAARILKNVKWTGYLAGAIHFIIVDGVLTYSDEPLV